MTSKSTQRGVALVWWLVGIFAAGALLFALHIWIMLNWNYSSGEQAGWVQKLSKKGYLCKTWEGEMAMVSLPGAMPEKFHFTVWDDATAAEDQPAHRAACVADLRGAHRAAHHLLRRDTPLRQARQAHRGYPCTDAAAEQSGLVLAPPAPPAAAPGSSGRPAQPPARSAAADSRSSSRSMSSDPWPRRVLKPTG